MKKIFIGTIILTIFSGCNSLEKKTNDNQINISQETLNSKIINITSSQDFDSQVFSNQKPCVVKFETKWCSACKVMEPIYEKLANKYFTKINFFKVDASNLGEIADKYNILGVPTFVLFKDNNIITQIAGEISEQELEEAINKLL
jgi:thioredoxin 1